MRFPSGDQAGKLSRVPEVSRCSPVPSRFTLKIPEPRRTNTIRFPSGANAGSVAGRLPVVTCVTPAPSVWTRKSCAGVVPSFEAEKTIQRGDAEVAGVACAAASPSAMTTAAEMTRPERNVIAQRDSTMAARISVNII